MKIGNTVCCKFLRDVLDEGADNFEQLRSKLDKALVALKEGLTEYQLEQVREAFCGEYTDGHIYGYTIDGHLAVDSVGPDTGAACGEYLSKDNQHTSKRRVTCPDCLKLIKDAGMSEVYNECVKHKPVKVVKRIAK
jgi:hypothetical protein